MKLTNILQAARSSEADYEDIYRANIYIQLHRLLAHSDHSIRSKACNLLGNLCRHSSFFYPVRSQRLHLAPLRGFVL